MVRYWFCLYILLLVMTTRVQSAVTSSRAQSHEQRRRRESKENGDMPIVSPELLPGLIEEVQFQSSLPTSSYSAWEQTAEMVLSRTQRDLPYPIEIEMHRVEPSADPGIACGSCRIWRKYITFRKPTCALVKIPVRSCRGLCESWEVSLM